LLRLRLLCHNQVTAASSTPHVTIQSEAE
jgi:hypothetical protein